MRDYGGVFSIVCVWLFCVGLVFVFFLGFYLFIGSWEFGVYFLGREVIMFLLKLFFKVGYGTFRVGYSGRKKDMNFGGGGSGGIGAIS